ncbi:MAG: hypothetical protein IV100_06730 [Myxococcales bacterium]|nr:hypothetical protein [Myxococcales bacterium]
MKPVARRSGLVVRPAGSDLVTLAPDHVVHRLGPVAAWVYAHADGTRDVDALLIGLRAAVDGDADKALVFEALDRLSDAGLLEARVAPPAGLSRRGLITRLAGASALAALTAVVGLPFDALAAGPACGDDKALIDEIAWLEAQTSAVADFLDQWEEEYAKAGDDTADAAAEEEQKASYDSFYADELAAREDKYKAKEAEEKELLTDAEFDLAACKIEKKKVKAGEREMDAKAHYKKRADEMATKNNNQQAKIADRQEQLRDREMMSKERYRKSAEKAGTDQVALEARRKRQDEETQKQENLLERRSERAHKHYQAQAQRLEFKKEDQAKKDDYRMVNAEETAKFQSQLYTEKASEEASKDAGVTDRALEIAQEETIKAGFAAEQKRKDYEQAQIATEQQQKKAQEAKQKNAAEENQKIDLKAQEQKEKYSATEQNSKLDLKAQEEMQKSSAVEEKQKLSASEQDAKYAELKKEQETKYVQAEQAQKANY